MHVCVCVYSCTYEYGCVCACMAGYMHICVLWFHAHMFVCVRTCMHVCAHVCMCAYVCICMCGCMYVWYVSVHMYHDASIEVRE